MRGRGIKSKFLRPTHFSGGGQKAELHMTLHNYTSPHKQGGGLKAEFYMRLLRSTEFTYSSKPR